VEFIHEALINMQEELKKHKSSLQTFYDTPQNTFTILLKKYVIQKVFANEDYEQYAIDRDRAISSL